MARSILHQSPRQPALFTATDQLHREPACLETRVRSNPDANMRTVPLQPRQLEARAQLMNFAEQTQFPLGTFVVGAFFARPAAVRIAALQAVTGPRSRQRLQLMNFAEQSQFFRKLKKTKTPLSAVGPFRQPVPYDNRRSNARWHGHVPRSNISTTSRQSQTIRSGFRRDDGIVR